MESITFHKNGYDPFIDFLKGWCILMVVVNHAFPRFLLNATLFSGWGKQAVPIFLLIQVFHAYKKGFDQPKPYWGGGYKRVIKPFLWMCLVICGIRLLQAHGDWYGVIARAIKGGGCEAMGTYYIWIYVQFAFLLSFLRPFFCKYDSRILLWTFIIVCELLEVLCSYIAVPMYLYRLLALRYIFLIYLGYKWVVEGLVMNWKTLLLSLISLFFILLTYTNLSLSPWVFDTNISWSCCHWFAYYYPAYLLVWILNKVYQWLQVNHSSICKGVLLMGKASMEIYLFQMLFFAVWFYSPTIQSDGLLLFSVNILMKIALAIVPAIVWYRWKIGRQQSL
jgi:peptidoglycan/LPS O-acetylase OafA/YrhL